MPWHPVPVSAVADHLSISAPQLRRRCVRTLGVTPKALQRTLRLQGFLALAQAGAAPTGRRNAEGLSGSRSTSGTPSRPTSPASVSG